MTQAVEPFLVSLARHRLSGIAVAVAGIIHARGGRANLNVSALSRDMGVSRKAVYEALNALATHRIIARDGAGWTIQGVTPGVTEAPPQGCQIPRVCARVRYGFKT